jgi:hypothetical protein
MEKLFEEKQILFLNPVVIGVCVFTLLILAPVFVLRNVSIYNIFLICTFTIIPFAFAGIISLSTKIDKSRIFFRLFPFKSNYIEWKDIRTVTVVKYNPLLEFGGWGLRYSLVGNRKAYSIAGNRGIQIELKTGEKILIGTGKEIQLKSVLSNFAEYIPSE